MSTGREACAAFLAAQSASDRMALRRAAWRYLRKPEIDSLDDMTVIVYWQELDNEVLQAHTEWLSRTRAAVEALGRPWTVDEMNLYLNRPAEDDE